MLFASQNICSRITYTDGTATEETSISLLFFSRTIDRGDTLNNHVSFTARKFVNNKLIQLSQVNKNHGFRGLEGLFLLTYIIYAMIYSVCDARE